MIRERVWVSGALLIVAVLLIVGWEKGLKPRRELKQERSSQTFSSLDPKQVYKIEISRGEKKDILSKRDNSWVVETDQGYPADGEAIGKALEAAKKLNCNQEVASGESEYARFDLEKDKALEVKIFGVKDKPLADFFVGKRGSTYESSYFRKADEQKVCLAYQNLITSFDRTNDTWRDKNILNFSAADCKTLKISDGSTVLWLDKDVKANKWELLEAQNRKLAATWAVDGICQTLAKLKTQAFPMTPPSEAGIENSTKKITVTLVGGNNYTIIVGAPAKGKENYYVKREDVPAVYELTQWQVNGLFKKRDELLEKLAVEPNQQKGATAAPAPEPPPVPAPPNK